MEKGVPIRVITRTLDVLRAINRGRSLSMTEISRACKLPYPTTCRIVHSLVIEGVIEMEPQRKAYRPTALAQSLSYGFQAENTFAACARPHIVELTHTIGWPAAVSTRVAESMVIRDSTHSLTTMTFSQYYPGFAMPLWSSASGKAHLAYCPEEERRSILESIRLKKMHFEKTEISDEEYINNIISEVREKGFATIARNTFTLDPGKTSSIAVPLFRGDEYVAALAIVFFSSAMSPTQAADKYLPLLLETQEKIKIAIALSGEEQDSQAALSEA